MGPWTRLSAKEPVVKSTVTLSFLLSIQVRSQVTYYANFLHPFQKAIWAAFVLYCKTSSACHLKPNPLGEILALFNLQQTGFQSLYLDSKETLACGAFSFVKPIDLLVCKTAVSGDTGPSSNGFFLLAFAECWGEHFSCSPVVFGLEKSFEMWTERFLLSKNKCTLYTFIFSIRYWTQLIFQQSWDWNLDLFDISGVT